MSRSILTAVVMTIVVLGQTSRLEAGLVVGSTVHGSLTSGIPPTFDGNATIADPGREFSGAYFPSFFGNIVINGYADLAPGTIRVGFECIPPARFAGASSGDVFTFTFTGLTLSGGEEIAGLSLLTNGRNRIPGVPDLSGAMSYSTTADSITIILYGFVFDPTTMPGDLDDSVTFTILTQQVVPEPSSLAMGVIPCLAGIAVWRRRLLLTCRSTMRLD
ncbi:hypothetical protein [Paludisphaera rhizosphaerae]|uniref:hypothetical protein n=1 Tax=Paludisphaera rhizosphaerae TaxID=2711216 RepID=UPI0013ED27FE|nr:hypothetical protein [Paludisphaera rhizosphaerae]